MSHVHLRSMDTSQEAPRQSINAVARGDVPVEAVLHDLAGVLRECGEKFLLQYKVTLIF